MAKSTIALLVGDIIEYYVADLSGTSNFVSVENFVCAVRVN